MPCFRRNLQRLCILIGVSAGQLGCSAANESPALPLHEAGVAPISNADADAAPNALPDATANPAQDATSGGATDAAMATRDAGAIPSDANQMQPEAGTRVEIETEQTFRDLRPEFLDYFWNNLDAARFEQWHPAAHETFSWTSPPKVPGDLGAELDAAYNAQVSLAGVPHPLRVRYVEARSPENRVTLESAFAADVWIDEGGPFRFVAQYQQEQDDVRVKQRLELPSGADTTAWRSYLEERMTNLAGFIREPFQKQYVEQELTKRGSVTITTVGLDFDIVVTQNIGKVTPQMVDWWWDNMGETERYRHWHPTAHQTFTWTMRPRNSNDLIYDVGSVQKIVEIIGESSTLNITWLDPAQLPIPRTYANFLYGQTNLDGTPFGGFLVHEYEALQTGGIRMKSTFRLPWLAGDAFAKALGEHCTQEMQFLQYYLPRLFAKEYKP